ncbi:hypothetical protein B0H19DRAFT_1257721 [Mycena capillaripes]|nr:hypothetical protein B0H19DRAFT_1257721 [Mycena capillaripes]
MPSHVSLNIHRLFWLSLVLLEPSVDALICHAADQNGNVLANSVQSADGSLVCTYTIGGVCAYSSDGQLNRLSSTDINCARLAIPDPPSSSSASSSSASSAPPSVQASSTPPSNPSSSPPSSNPPSPPPSSTPPDLPVSSHVLAAPPPPPSQPSSSGSSLGPSSSSSPSSSGSAGRISDPPIISSSTTDPGASSSASAAPNSHKNATRTAAIVGSIAAVLCLACVVVGVLLCRARRRRQRLDELVLPEQFRDEEEHAPRLSTVLASVPIMREKDRRTGVGAHQRFGSNYTGSDSTGSRPVSRQRFVPESRTLSNYSSDRVTSRDGPLSLRVERMEAQLETLLAVGAPEGLPPCYPG